MNSLLYHLKLFWRGWTWFSVTAKNENIIKAGGMSSIMYRPKHVDGSIPGQPLGLNSTWRYRKRQRWAIPYNLNIWEEK
jgi:hypothetical protein